MKYLSCIIINKHRCYADTNAFNLNNVTKNIKVQRSFISYFGENTENHWSRVGKNLLLIIFPINNTKQKCMKTLLNKKLTFLLLLLYCALYQ